jgi:hypothetical protein
MRSGERVNGPAGGCTPSAYLDRYPGATLEEIVDTRLAVDDKAILDVLTSGFHKMAALRAVNTGMLLVLGHIRRCADERDIVFVDEATWARVVAQVPDSAEKHSEHMVQESNGTHTMAKAYLSG